ncbi:TIM barrel protein [Microlunatus elymi]|uniref:mannonate dehydratase n=1 Tax=Microlunatus elymi TaxID=2596828 RepID=A0A516Q5W1_9ACTN|nr:TIM barrel protein [Microlunatus elymi]
MKIADALPPTPSPMWDLCKQMGITDAVCSVPEGPDQPPPWDFDHLFRLNQRFADAGLRWSVIESAPAAIQEPIKLGLPERDRHIDQFNQLLENMGRLGIEVICHNWMAGLSWMRTSFALRGRGGALVTGYDHSALANAPLTRWGEISESQLWENMHYFLEAVVPVAEQNGVRLAVHPDDPPISPIRGIARILTSPEAMKRVIDLVPSPNNGVTLCQGTVSSMGVDIPSAIKLLGSTGRVFFVHFRDVRGGPERFTETFQDDGQTDMAAAIRAYEEVGFDGYLRVDHVPTMASEDNDSPGYETLGRLFAVGYVRGLIDATNHGALT